MTGAEHFAAAERLVAEAAAGLENATRNTWDEAQLIAASLFAQAQVHATLALAATQVDIDQVLALIADRMRS